MFSYLCASSKAFYNEEYLNNILRLRGSKWQLSLFLKETTVHLLAFTDRHDVTETKFSFTSLATYFDLITPLVRSQRQADAVYLYFDSTLYFVIHTTLFFKASCFGISGGYVTWLLGYRTYRKSQIRVFETLFIPV
jgi:hypothetical protein